ncbi:DMT family transporter [Vibrio harveyi]|uniref:DMT family transporter n=1 Tax=Vibrio harveyi TaxID=669 RepID=UPI0030F9E56A
MSEVRTASTSGPEKKMSKPLAYMFIMIGIFALAFSAIMVKEANFEPATNAFLRCLVGFLVLIPFAVSEIKKKGLINKSGFALAIVAGIFLGLDMTSWNFAIFFIGAGISSILLNLQIIIMPLLAMTFDKFKPEKSFWFLVPIMLFGIVLAGGVLEGGPSEGPSTMWGYPIALVGTILGIKSGICYALYLYTSRKSGTLNAGRYFQPLMWVFLAQLIPAAIVMATTHGFNITTGVLVDGKLPLSAADGSIAGDAINMSNWIWIVILGVVGHAVAWVFVQIGSVNLDPTVVAGLLLLSPITTVLVAPFTSGESVTLLQSIGVVIVLVAVAYQNGLHTAVLNKFKGEPAKVES